MNDMKLESRDTAQNVMKAGILQNRKAMSGKEILPNGIFPCTVKLRSETGVDDIKTSSPNIVFIYFISRGENKILKFSLQLHNNKTIQIDGELSIAPKKHEVDDDLFSDSDDEEDCFDGLTHFDLTDNDDKKYFNELVENFRANTTPSQQLMERIINFVKAQIKNKNKNTIITLITPEQAAQLELDRKKTQVTPPPLAKAAPMTEDMRLRTTSLAGIFQRLRPTNLPIQNNKDRTLTSPVAAPDEVNAKKVRKTHALRKMFVVGLLVNTILSMHAAIKKLKNSLSEATTAPSEPLKLTPSAPPYAMVHIPEAHKKTITTTTMKRLFKLLNDNLEINRLHITNDSHSISKATILQDTTIKTCEVNPLSDAKKKKIEHIQLHTSKLKNIGQDQFKEIFKLLVDECGFDSKHIRLVGASTISRRNFSAAKSALSEPISAPTPTEQNKPKTPSNAPKTNYTLLLEFMTAHPAVSGVGAVLVLAGVATALIGFGAISGGAGYATFLAHLATGLHLSSPALVSQIVGGVGVGVAGLTTLGIGLFAASTLKPKTSDPTTPMPGHQATA